MARLSRLVTKERVRDAVEEAVYETVGRIPKDDEMIDAVADNVYMLLTELDTSDLDLEDSEDRD